MRIYIFFLFFSLVLFCTNETYSQDLKSSYDSFYNKNPELYNGIIFSNIYTRSVEGTQFFEENTFRRNDLGLIANNFEDQYINYDVYHQKLLLTFIDDNHSQKMVEIPTENIQYFYIGDNYFEVLKDSEGEYKFFQVYPFQESKLLIRWIKYMKANSSTVKNSYRFTDMKKQIWILQNGEYLKIDNNKDLIANLPENQHSIVQTWLKENKVKIQKADNSKMQLLITFLNSGI